MEVPIAVSSQFRGKVLQKVYRVWLFRKFLPVVILELVVLTFLLFQLGKLVFVQKILENALNVLFLHPGKIGDFVFTMIYLAPWATRVLGVFVVAVIALLIRQISQGLLRLFLVRQNYFRKVQK